MESFGIDTESRKSNFKRVCHDYLSSINLTYSSFATGSLSIPHCKAAVFGGVLFCRILSVIET